MITNIFKNFLSALYTTSGSTAGGNRNTIIPFKTVAGDTRYVTPSASSGSFPAQVGTGLVLNTSSAGIVIGSGTTAPDGTDYSLGNQIKTGVSGTITTSADIDNNGDFVTEYTVALTNTGESSITVSEIGKTVYLLGATSKGGTTSTYAFLADRTLLDSPVTIAASGTATIKYTLKGIFS